MLSLPRKLGRTGDGLSQGDVHSDSEANPFFWQKNTRFAKENHDFDWIEPIDIGDCV